MDQDRNGSVGVESRLAYVQTLENECDPVVVPTSPGWLWLGSIVAVSLGLWVGVIWLAMRVIEWLS